MSTADFLYSSPALFALLSGLTGLIVGSFLNVVIYRLPLMMKREWRAQCAELLDQPQDKGMNETFNLWTPRSRCPECRHPISPAENLPIVSYLLQRGRCAHCSAPIPVQYPAVEATSALLTAIVAWHYGFGWQAAAAMLLTWSLITLSVIDFRHKLLPDVITLPFLWLGIGIALLGVFTDLQSSVVGAMCGYLSLWFVFHAFRILTGKDGMGFGDFKLFAMLGAWQGWQSLLPIILLSSCVGAALGIVLILIGGRDRSIPMPFGPFLAAAGWITLLWGESLSRFYVVSIWPG